MKSSKPYAHLEPHKVLRIIVILLLLDPFGCGTVLGEQVLNLIRSF